MSLVSLVIVAATAIASIAAVVVAGLALRQAGEKNDADTKIEKRVNDFNELTKMNDILRVGLNEAQDQTDKLTTDLAAAQRDLDRVNRSLDRALANVTLLNEYIEEHVPAEVPRPRLRPVI